MEDHLIIQLFLERSESTVLELARKYGGLCRSIARNILKNSEDAEECFNDTLLAVWNAIPPERPDKIQPYVCRIARNLSLKKYHSNTAQKRNRQYDVILEEIADCLDSGRSVGDRIIFVQRYWYCLSVSEIAENLHMTPNAARVCLHRTREKLKQYLKWAERGSL